MRRSTLPLFLALLLAVPVMTPVDAEETHGGRYVAANLPLRIACDTESSAPWLPEIPDPNWLVPGPGNLFDGEPECAWADVANDARELQGEPRVEWGLAGFGWRLPPAALGAVVHVRAVDDLSYVVPVRLVVITTADDEVAIEGCGAQSMRTPTDMRPHWQSPPDAPTYLLGAFLPSVMVTPELGVCMATTGWVEATYPT